jgi:D-serine dehydratase
MEEQITGQAPTTASGRRALDALRQGRPAAWLRARVTEAAAVPAVVQQAEVEDAARRLERFAPLLAALFPASGWDGRVRSELRAYPAGDARLHFVKADHALPLTGSVKARGGLHAVLHFLEKIAIERGLIRPGDAPAILAQEAARRLLSDYAVVVASTGNLGYSVGLVARGLGLAAEVHMSSEAKSWKKQRLREIGATVIEHDADYAETIVRARAAAQGRDKTLFIDDETSRELFTGYACAGRELCEQLEARGLRVTPSRPLVVYLPCGVGGAPGGIAYGLKSILGAAVITVFAEPVASACMMAALASGDAAPPSVYDLGLDNRTIADGLAVPRASALVVEAVGPVIDAVVAVDDAALLAWVSEAWRADGLRLEPAAAAAFAAMEPFRVAAQAAGWPCLDDAVHVFWTTGGSRLPDDEFAALLAAA